MARIALDKFNHVESPTLILQNRNFDTIGNIVNASQIEYKENFNGANTASFSIYKTLNGVENKHWDDIVDFKILYIPELQERFEIAITVSQEDSAQKTVECQSLCESELSQITIRDIEINTSDDIAREGYTYVWNNYDENFPTVFYRNPDNWLDYDWSDSKYSNYSDHAKYMVIKNSSLLHRLLDKAPNYTISHVDKSLCNLQREFSISESSIYDELTGEIAEEFGCLFLFDSLNREIRVYDLYHTCNSCGYRGDYTDKCPECGSSNISGGYGEDTIVFISNQNLATEMSLETNADSLKNCFYVNGGDDTINAAIASCNPNGSRYIYIFTDDVKKDMPDVLRQKVESYNSLCSEYKTSKTFSLNSTIVNNYNSVVSKVNSTMGQEYKSLTSPLVGYSSTTTAMYEAIDLYDYIKTSMIPNININGLGLQESLQAIVTGFSKGLAVLDDNGNIKNDSTFANTVAVSNLKTVVSSTVTNTVKNTANLFYSSAYYDCDVNGSYNSSTHKWTGNFKLTSLTETDDNGNYISGTTSTITLNVIENLVLFLQQSINKAMYNKDQLEVAQITSLEMNDTTFKEELSKYSLDELNILYESFTGCLGIIVSAEISDETLKNRYYNFYNNRIGFINTELSTRTVQLSYIKAVYNYTTTPASGIIANIRNNVSNTLDFEKYLGEDLWKLFCCYRREDTYSNSNYISDGLTNSEIVETAQKLLSVASKELYNAANLQYTVTTTMNNLLVIPEFQKVSDKFSIGNFLRTEIDGKICKLRLLSYDFSYDEPDKLSVEFSTVEKIYDGQSDFNSILKSASSLATSYPSTAKQVEKNAVTAKVLDGWVSEGLNATNTKFATDENSKILIDENGILGRHYDYVTDSYSDYQFRLIGNGLYLTNDAWKTIFAGLGKFTYKDIDGNTVDDFGLIAKTVVGSLVAGEKLQIYNSSGSVQITGEGLIVKNGYLSIKDDSYGSVTIDPKQASNDKGYVFSVKDKNGNVTIGADIDGNAIFKGKIVAYSGEFNGTVIGGGININNKFIVTSDGNVTLPSDASISYGDSSKTINNYVTQITKDTVTTEYVNALEVTAKSVAAENITGTTIRGKVFDGGSINIGDNFKVDNKGNVTANNAILNGASLSGNLIAQNIKIADNLYFYVSTLGVETYSKMLSIELDNDSGGAGSAYYNLVIGKKYGTRLAESENQSALFNETIIKGNLHTLGSCILNNGKYFRSMSPNNGVLYDIFGMSSGNNLQIGSGLYENAVLDCSTYLSASVNLNLRTRSGLIRFYPSFTGNDYTSNNAALEIGSTIKTSVDVVVSGNSLLNLVEKIDLLDTRVRILEDK